jgi:hypothetical protein
MPEPNLFSDLFSVRIREDHSPKENFLSECFAHILRAVPGACEGWVSRIYDRSVILPGHTGMDLRDELIRAY